MHKKTEALTIAFLGFAIAACAPVTRSYYLPTSAEHSFENRSCGWVPSGGYYATLTKVAALSIRATPEEGTLRLSIQYILTSNRVTLRMESKEIYVQAPNQLPITIDAKSRNREFPSLDPTIEIQGSGQREIQVSNFKVTGFSHPEFTLTLPPLVINGDRYVLKPIYFKRVDKAGLRACVQ
jgi:hypothetical protein